MKVSTPKGPMTDPTVLTHCILPYVISSCHRKMLRRFNATTSQLYIKALDKIGNFEPDNYLLMNAQPTPNEIDSDRQFLLDYVLAGTKMHPIKIPELTKQANLAYNNKPFKLFNRSTCLEFHEVLKTF